jgi:uncharacterized protein (TIGR01777 family)
MPTILITGGTGMIGRALSKALLEKGYEVIILSRGSGVKSQESGVRSRESIPGVEYAYWDIKKKTIDQVAVAKADHIIHLAGANLAEKRWTRERKQEIVKSRVESGKLIVESLRNIPNQVKTLISISGIGYYGPDRPGTTNFTEKDPVFDDFLAQVCNQWEETLYPVKTMGKRLVTFRTGVVLSNNGGIVKEFLKPLKFGIAPILGSGKQILSWIHIDDLVRMFISAIANEDLSGVYNAVTPEPVSNKEFVLQLAKIKKGNLFIAVPVPSFLLKLILGEMSIEVLKSARVSSKKIEGHGFVLQYPTIKMALQNLK